jgi:hypothetical protein
MRYSFFCLFVTFFLFSTNVCSQVPVCSTTEEQSQAATQVVDMLNEMKETSDSRKAMIDVALKNKSAALDWTDEKASALLDKIESTPNFIAMSKETTLLYAEMGQIVVKVGKSDTPESKIATCEDAKRVVAILSKIRDIEARQHNLVISEIESAK